MDGKRGDSVDVTQQWQEAASDQYRLAVSGSSEPTNIPAEETNSHHKRSRAGASAQRRVVSLSGGSCRCWNGQNETNARDTRRAKAANPKCLQEAAGWRSRSGKKTHKPPEKVVYDLSSGLTDLKSTEAEQKENRGSEKHDLL